MKLKRREILLAAAAASAPGTAAQTPAAGSELLELARRAQKTNREALEKVKLPMAAEPAFTFKA